jgi:Zn-dependent peptidase ImmA (M78 family)/transcriptional regulator with XRE-family HTH domain
MVNNGSSFEGARLHLARILRGMSQADLGEAIATSHAFVSQMENGIRLASSINIHAIASVLGFEESFFFKPLKFEFREDECHFCRRRTTPVGVRTRILAHGTLFAELVDFLDAVVSLPSYSVPTIRSNSTLEIEKAAEQCRTKWGLGIDLPIKNMVRILECAGIVVTRFPATAGKIDAFSRSGHRGIVVLNTDKGSTSRARYDMAHECGHLVLHAGLDATVEEQEDEANRFASAFLLPRTGFVREFPRFSGRIRLEDLIPMKLRWKTSIATIVRRAFDLKLIDGLTYQQGVKQIYARGWHKGEPPQTEPPDEPPELVKISFDLLQKTVNKSRADIARDLGWTAKVLADIVPDALDGLPLDAPPSNDGKVIAVNFSRPRNT